MIKQIAVGLALSLACNAGVPAFADSQPATNAAPCISWISPLVKPRFALLCVHGLGLYSKSYQNFGMRMSHHGAAVYAIDVRGFGSWMKAKGHADLDFNGCLQDIKQTLISIRQAHPGLPVFLLGESMGGAIALRAASMYPDLLNGLISSVPAGDRFQQKRTDVRVALELLTGPNRMHDIGKKVVQQASTAQEAVDADGKKAKVVNQELVQAWEGDPLDRMDLSAKELIQFQRFMNENHDSAKNITTLPVLMLQGIDDRLVRPDGTWELFKDLGTHNRTLVCVPSRHLIFEEAQTSSENVTTETTHLVMGWVMAQINRNPAAVAGGAAAEAGSSALSVAVDELVNAHYEEATRRLEDIVESDPNNAEAHYWLGVGYLKERRPPMLARREFQTAMRLSAGQGHGEKANEYLLDLASKSDHDSDDGDAAPAQVEPGIAAKLTNGKPTIVTFYAPWCEQCNKLDKILMQVEQLFGDKVTRVKVDVSDKANEETIRALNVGPIPTIVFLKPNGTVSSTLIGQSSFVNVAKAIATLVK